MIVVSMCLSSQYASTQSYAHDLIGSSRDLGPRPNFKTGLFKVTMYVHYGWNSYSDFRPRLVSRKSEKLFHP